MKRGVVGVIGHVDHGKTALVRALTGIETDRLAEEKRRGISIALGFAHVQAGADTIVDLIDMPGHERFVRTMVSGATGIDAALLVVAANEGIQAQTVEHVDIAGLLGLRRAVVAVSKADLVTPEQAHAVGEAAVALLRRAGIEAEAPVLTAAVAGVGMEALRAALAGLVEGAARPAAEGLAFLPIDRAFSIAGHGTVVTGTLRGAALAPGDRLDLLPGGRSVRVRALQVHGARVALAAPGQRVAVNLRDVEVGDVAHGAALAASGSLAASRWLTLSLRGVEDAAPLANGARLRALLGTAEVDTRLRLLDCDVLEPGGRALGQLHCAEAVALPAGEHVVLRLASPARTVAGGRIIEPEAARRRRYDPAVLARLADLASSSPEAIVQREVERTGAAGATLAGLARISALSPVRVAQIASAGSVVTRRGLVVARAALDDVAAAAGRIVAGGAGVTREALAQGLPGVGPEVLDEAVSLLLVAGGINDRGGVLAVKGRELDRAAGEAALAVAAAEALRQGGLAPPDAAEVAPGPQGQRALDRLVREGVVVRAHDRAQKRVILFHQAAIEEAQGRLAPLLARPPGLLVSEVGAALGISRKFSVPLLEHLDLIRFTRRIQDRRMLAAPAPPR